MLTLKQYTAVGVASGAGRNGQTECNGLKLQLATPKELGGTGQGENPEQLFAMGYSGEMTSVPMRSLGLMHSQLAS